MTLHKNETLEDLVEGVGASEPGSRRACRRNRPAKVLLPTDPSKVAIPPEEESDEPMRTGAKRPAVEAGNPGSPQKSRSGMMMVDIDTLSPSSQNRVPRCLNSRDGPWRKRRTRCGRKFDKAKSGFGPR